MFQPTFQYRAGRPAAARFARSTLIALLALFGCGISLAQEQPRPQTTGETRDPTLPVGAVRSFVDAARAADYEKAARFLDLSALPEGERATAGPQLARHLKTVLDRKLWIHYELLSDRPEGNLEDGLPPDLERLGSIDGEELLMQRIALDDGRRVWKLSEGSVGQIPGLYERHGYGPLGELLPEPLFEVQFLEIELWQWIGLLVLVVAAYVLSMVAVWVLYRFLRPIAARTDTTLDDDILEGAAAPLRFALALAVFAAGTLLLALSVPAYQFLAALLKALTIVAMAWFALRAVDISTVLLSKHFTKTDRESAVALLPMGRRVAKAALGAVALLAVLQNLGFNVTGVLAGLGVGGLAVALAAQKTIANLFGGLSLVADQPVRVGQFCRYGGDKLGTVEEIGLRSTRIRSLDRTLITIPNSDFSELQLENFAARDRIRLTTTLGLRYETTPDQLRHVIAQIRKLLIAHPRVTQDPARVRFVSFGAHSLDLEIFAYVDTGDWNEFLQIREDLFLRLMDIVQASGSGFAFPSQTLYLGRDGGLDAQRVDAAEAEVRAWREEGALPFPDYADARIAELDGTLDYPPRGSVRGG